MIRKTPIELFFTHYILLFLFFKSEAKCKNGCNLAIASYCMWEGSNLTYISKIFNQSTPEILKYNPTVTNPDQILSNTRINVPFSCDCLNGDFLGHTFTYKTQFGDRYDNIAQFIFSNLSTEDWVHRVNIFDTTRIPEDAPINVTVNCSCGDRSVSRDYGLFATYPLRDGENLSYVGAEFRVSTALLERYNPGTNFSGGAGLVFVPARDQSGNFPPLKLSTGGISGGAIASISVAGVSGALILAVCAGFYRRKKVVEVSLFPIRHGHGSGNTLEKTSESAALGGAASLGLTDITVDRSVEFSYEELAQATDEFSMVNKIGQGGFGSVFYAELRGVKAAIKKMDMPATKEFLAELKVLTHVHHLNLEDLQRLQEESLQEGVTTLTVEEMSACILGTRRNHVRGFKTGPKPSSSTANSLRGAAAASETRPCGMR